MCSGPILSGASMTLQALPVPSMPKRFAASASTWKLSPGKGPVRQRRLVPPKRSDTEDAFSNDLGRLASATGGSTVTCDRAHDQGASARGNFESDRCQSLRNLSPFLTALSLRASDLQTA